MLCLLLKLCSVVSLQSHSLGESFMTYKSEGTPLIMAPGVRTSAFLHMRCSVMQGQSALAMGTGPRRLNAEVRRRENRSKDCCCFLALPAIRIVGFGFFFFVKGLYSIHLIPFIHHHLIYSGDLPPT